MGHEQEIVHRDGCGNDLEFIQIRVGHGFLDPAGIDAAHGHVAGNLVVLAQEFIPGQLVEHTGVHEHLAGHVAGKCGLSGTETELLALEILQGVDGSVVFGGDDHGMEKGFAVGFQPGHDLEVALVLGGGDHIGAGADKAEVKGS